MRDQTKEVSYDEMPLHMHLVESILLNDREVKFLNTFAKNNGNQNVSVAYPSFEQRNTARFEL